jgi:hypothetical protein
MELAGDAWEELSGYDGRIAATFRALLRPGLLTMDYLKGHRARYLKPVRLYLTVSVVYFLLAAAAPNLDPSRSSSTMGLRITTKDGSSLLSAEDRAEMLKDLDDAHWALRPLLQSMLEDPDGFRARAFTIMPRVFFGLLPVFAGIIALFYRGRTFPTSLVFATHLHAFAFLAFAVSEASKFSQSLVLSVTVGIAAAIGFVVYALRAFRAVFGGSWPATTLKAVGIGMVYLFASLPAFLIILYWASLR